MDLQEELEWLVLNPQFEERPATLSEFLGPNYLNLDKYVRQRVRKELEAIIGEEINPKRITKFPYAMITGGIGIGKTTIASVVLPYLIHWCLCLKDPQTFFDLMPGSRIAFMQMSTSEDQAKEVIFGDIKARISYSPWFKNHPFDPSFKNQLRFEKDLWILPGDSKDTTFEGYNILGGIIDEADSHQVTEKKDYAQNGFETIDGRITSRFQNRGFLLVIGQMKKSDGFAKRTYDSFRLRKDAYAVRLAIWDSMGEDFYNDPERGNGKWFYYDIQDKKIVPDSVATFLGGSERFLRIPEFYRDKFETYPEKALKDLAGIPPLVGDAFISIVSKVHACRDRWIMSHSGLGSPMLVDGTLESWFVAQETIKRTGHLDIAYSAEGDALGFAMGHVSKMLDVDGERKPYIVIDLLMRVKAPAGGEIFLADIRHRIYNLRDERKFNLKKVTMDGFQSTDTRQQLERRRYEVDEVSVDKQVLPYHDLREAIYEDRIEFPPYIVEISNDSGTRKVEILVEELTHLMDMGKKIDHPVGGSKDVADAVAGVTFTLMGDRQFKRGVVNLGLARAEAKQPANSGNHHPAYRGDFGLSAPVPPTVPWSMN